MPPVFIQSQATCLSISIADRQIQLFSPQSKKQSVDANSTVSTYPFDVAVLFYKSKATADFVPDSPLIHSAQLAGLIQEALNVGLRVDIGAGQVREDPVQHLVALHCQR